MSNSSEITPPTSIAAQNAGNEVESSSDDEEENYTFEEAYESWFLGKSQSTCTAYRGRVKNFMKWYETQYGRKMDGSRLKKKHIRLFFAHKQRTCNQLRATIVCIKSFLRHLFKKRILGKDLAKSFIDPRQKPPQSERVMTPGTVKLFFKEAQKKKDASTLHMLQVLTYGGVRITALSRLHATDIKEEEHQANGTITKSYKIHIRNGKGGKSRFVPLKASVGADLYAYAQSLDTMYLFPGQKEGKPMNSQSISNRIKRIARKIGQPQISCHFFRHFMASNALHAGGNLADISKALGHAQTSTTSLYLHASGANVSGLIDLTNSDGDDDTLAFNPIVEIKIKKEVKKKKKSKKVKSNKIPRQPKSQDFSSNSSKGMFI